MVEANPIIPGAWIKFEALRLAKIAVRADIRDQGLKLKDYAAKDITALAEQRWQGFLDQARINLAEWAESQARQ